MPRGFGTARREEDEPSAVAAQAGLFSGTACRNLCAGEFAQQRDALAEFLDIATVDIGFESLDGFQQLSRSRNSVLGENKMVARAIPGMITLGGRSEEVRE